MLRAACIQLTGGADRARNLEAAGRLVARAAEDGAELVVLPERWECVGGPAELHAAAERFDETVDVMRGWARGHGLWLIGGSISEPSGERLRNTTVVFSPDGDEAARYAKVHLFDVEVPGGIVYRESANDDAGAEVVAFAGPGGVVVGLTICYDLRFPELFRALADRGAELVVCPSSFTAVTGAAHWHVLLRARAIENGCYVAAAAQAGEVAPGRPAYGHALVVDPWGEVLAEAPGEGEAVVCADVDRAHVHAVRQRLPSLAHRRPDVYA